MAARKHHSLRTEDQLGLDRFTILSVSFNQDQSCFAVGTENGFLVYNTDPMECRVQRDLQDGGIGFVQMLYRTNYLALVGGGRTPKFPQNKVVIWDDLKRQAALSIDFLSPALRVILSRTHIVVCLRSKIHIYTFASPPAPLAVYETADNPLGVCSLSNSILVFPARTEGQIQIVDLSPQGQERNLISIIKAHKSAIKCLAVSMDGALVASASDTGTIIRIHVSATTALLHEFRRGLDRAFIYSLSFSHSSSRLALLSDKGTLHVYSVSAISSNRRHILGKVPLMPRYFSSEWSFVSARVAEEPGVVGWSGEDSVIVIWTRSARWEKYVIVEREYDNPHRRSPSLSPPGSQTPTDPDISEDQHSTTKWELIREGWRNIAEAC